MSKSKIPAPRGLLSRDCSKRAVASVERALKGEFENFLNNSSLAERMFLRDVLNWHNSRSSGNENELAIASAFEEELRGCAADWTMVPAEEYRRLKEAEELRSRQMPGAAN